MCLYNASGKRRETNRLCSVAFHRLPHIPPVCTLIIHGEFEWVGIEKLRGTVDELFVGFVVILHGMVPSDTTNLL